MTDALFYDANSALLECFQILATPVMPMNFLGKMQKPSYRTTKKWQGMTPLERQGQAAQVIAIVEKMQDQSAKEYIFAAYLGFKTEATGKLLQAVMAGLPTGLHQRRGVQSVLKSYFGHPINARSMRYDLHCKQQDLAEYRRCIGDTASRIGARAMEYIEVQLEIRGLIVSESANVVAA